MYTEPPPLDPAFPTMDSRSTTTPRTSSPRSAGPRTRGCSSASPTAPAARPPCRPRSRTPSRRCTAGSHRRSPPAASFCSTARRRSRSGRARSTSAVHPGAICVFLFVRGLNGQGDLVDTPLVDAEVSNLTGFPGEAWPTGRAASTRRSPPTWASFRRPRVVLAGEQLGLALRVERSGTGRGRSRVHVRPPELRQPARGQDVLGAADLRLTLNPRRVRADGIGTVTSVR